MSNPEVEGLIQITIGMATVDRVRMFEPGEDLAGFSRWLSDEIIRVLGRHGYEVTKKGSQESEG